MGLSLWILLLLLHFNEGIHGKFVELIAVCERSVSLNSSVCLCVDVDTMFQDKHGFTNVNWTSQA